jgi:hypothetical protein
LVRQSCSRSFTLSFLIAKEAVGWGFSSVLLRFVGIRESFYGLGDEVLEVFAAVGL